MRRVRQAMLDQTLSYEIDSRHCLRLPFAPNAADALFKLGRIPGQIEIDYAARHLNL
jgi:hypothetical protein